MTITLSDVWTLCLSLLSVTLILLIVLLCMMKKALDMLRTLASKTQAQAVEQAGEKAAPAGVSQAAPVAAIPDRKLFDAVVASAIATYLNKDIRGLRILSVRPIAAENTQNVQRRQFVAAVAAAVATYMGTNVNGLRIHSIKKI